MTTVERMKLEKKIKSEGNFRIFNHRGLTGLILRPQYVNEIGKELGRMFFLTGYVLIPENTKLGKWLWKMGEDYISSKTDVHGGITYFEINDGLLWIGFDCGHAWDLDDFNDIGENRTYRDMEFVRNEIQSLIDQLLWLYAIDNGISFGDSHD